MEFFLTPVLTVQIVYLTGLAVAVGYLFRLREKSTETKRIFDFLLLWFVHLSIVTGYDVTHTHMLTAGPGFENAPIVTAAYRITQLALLYFLGWLTYRLVFRFSKWEERLISILIVTAVVYTTYWYIRFEEDVPFLVDRFRVGTQFVLLLNAWIALAGIRKVLIARYRGYGSREQQLLTMISLAALARLVMFTAGSDIAVWPFSAELRGVLPTLLAVSVAGFVVLGYLLYSDERHTLQVKLVGFLMIAYVSIFVSLVPTMRTEVALRGEFEDPDNRPSLVFTPDSMGGYTVLAASPGWITPAGNSHSLADDAAVAVRSAFDFPFYGTSYDSLWVGSNGSISFERELDADETFSSGLSVFDPTPSANPLYSDLIMAGTQADLRIESTPERLVATWIGINLYDLHEATISMQGVLYPDGVIRFNYRNIAALPLLRYVGITPGGPAESVRMPDEDGATKDIADGRAFLQRVDRRDAYRRFVHPTMVPILKIGIAGLLLLLLGGLIFYRIGLLNPLERVLSGLRDVENGDLETEVRIAERNELGTLADYFNRMTASIRRYNEHMEDLVDERTAELRATQKQLIEQEKLASLGSLTAGIAHEIKNPLNFVNNFAEVSEELMDELAEAVSAGDSDEAATLLGELRENARQIAKHGGRADSIVRSMMQHARGGASDRETIDVNTFVEEYVDLAWHGMRARDHMFECDVERTFDPDAGSIEGQPQELGRVLLNLLNNAFYAIGMDGAAAEPKVRLTTSRTDGGVHITVEDSGPGIPDDIRDRIFEPFFTTKPTGEGTGLGLSLSYDIVTQGHGGEMTVENAPDSGARFHIRLPA